MAGGDEYSAVSGGGKLKLKGGLSKVEDGRVDKKKKKKKKKDKKDKQEDDNTSQNLEAAAVPGDDESESLDKRENANESDEKQRVVVYKTEAERKYEEQRKKKLNERLRREGVKTHKERVEELNRYLSTLSEHHDMPKIGPG